MPVIRSRCMNKRSPTQNALKEIRKKWSMLGSDGVDFLLLAHDPTHPELDILWDLTQLYLHLDFFLRPTVDLDSVLVQLLSESYVGGDNWSFVPYEIDRGRS